MNENLTGQKHIHTKYGQTQSPSRSRSICRTIMTYHRITCPSKNVYIIKVFDDDSGAVVYCTSKFNYLHKGRILDNVDIRMHLNLQRWTIGTVIDVITEVEAFAEML